MVRKIGVFWVLVVFAAGLAYCGDSAKKSDSGFELFAFDNYMSGGEYKEPQVRADVLKELGYGGMSYHGMKGIDKTIEVFKDKGLKLYITYLWMNLDAAEIDKRYEADLKENIKKLKGTGTDIWFYITSKKYKPGSAEGDAAAVETLRGLADLADECGVKIVLYPHKGVYTETFADSLRIARKVNRRNVGVSFNVCHWLKVDGDVDYKPIVKESLPYLFVVTTNGAETGETKKMGWNKLIQTLDKGSFDNRELLEYLNQIGYKGPIGLQGYSIKGDPKENLESSMKAWKKLLITNY